MNKLPLPVQQGETEMRFKQNQQEYEANMIAFEQSILPAVLKKNASIGSYFVGWLQDNCMDANGVIDVSVTNMRRACSALHAAGLLKKLWVVAPNQKQVRNDARVENTDTSQTNVVTEAVEKFDATVQQAAAAECLSLIRTYRGPVHSLTYKRRDLLQAKFYELTSQKVKPTAIKTALENMVNGFPN